ncbi:MAG: GNAT family N-acetyltransferase [Sphingomonadaceae bacterium]|nr:GNAT family N-acetyltransferase [Sphingomonadaceae bacterium]
MAAPPPVLTTERLVLRPLVEDDAEALHLVLSDRALMTWWSSAPHRDLAETQAYVAGNAAQDPWITWAITREDDVAIGWVVLNEKREGVAEIGYILGRDHWGQGFAGEAVSAVIDHAFESLGYRRLYADTDPDNEASNRLLKFLGFRREGYLREEWETHLGVRDSVIWGLLAREWGKRRASDEEE